MHQYLRAVGFSDIKSRKQMKELLNDVINNSSKRDFDIFKAEDGNVYFEYRKKYCSTCGLILRGGYDEDSNMMLDYYYPFVSPGNISTTEEIIFERHSCTDSYSGVCDDLRVGVSLIYYVQNGMFLMKNLSDGEFRKAAKTTSLSALSLGGTIMLPIQKNPKDQEKIKKASVDRNKRIIAAKNGDEEAIEQLTLEDIDIYSAVSKKLLSSDIFTFVDSYFMPFGVECDHYSILGEIEDYRLESNSLTDEQLYILDINCNNLPITVCLNKKDLLGAPEIGRRFRGNIWLQGQIGV